MNLAVLFSGGKDSTYAAWLAKKEGYKTSCLISIISKNQDSYMFHTPSIEKTKIQAKAMGIPLIVKETKGEKEKELEDLEDAIKEAIKKYKVQGVITGAIQSVYQASRIQKICNKLGIECFNPLWQKQELEHLNDLVKNKFKVIIIGVAAYPLDQTFLGKIINKSFIDEIRTLNKKYKISMIGEGGEFETFVLDCPLFKKPLKVKKSKITGKDHNWRMEVSVE